MGKLRKKKVFVDPNKRVIPLSRKKLAINSATSNPTPFVHDAWVLKDVVRL